MKKYLLAACLALVAGPVMAGSGIREIPTAPGNGLATADYGGVDISTIAFSSSNVLLWGPGSPFTDGTRFPGGSGSIAFIHVTSASASATLSDAIIIRSTGTFISTSAVSGGGISTNGDYSTGNEVYRIYVGTAIGTGQGYQNQWVSNGATGFDYVFPKPIRLTNGAMVKTTSINFGPIVIGYTKHGK